MSNPATLLYSRTTKSVWIITKSTIYIYIDVTYFLNCVLLLLMMKGTQNEQNHVLYYYQIMWQTVTQSHDELFPSHVVKYFLATWQTLTRSKFSIRLGKQSNYMYMYYPSIGEKLLKIVVDLQPRTSISCR